MISHKHKFIFVHINKCGGTSIESELVRYCDNFSQKYAHITNMDKLLKVLGQAKHQTIQQMINEQTQDYFKFSFVRNPWSKLVSTYFFRVRENLFRNKGLTFREFIKYKLPRKNSVNLRYDCYDSTYQYNWLCDNSGNLRVDFIGRFENLQGDFNTICDKIGIPRKQLPHKNKTKHKHYTEYYDDETREIVAERYKRDVESFGYEFGEG